VSQFLKKLELLNRDAIAFDGGGRIEITPGTDQQSQVVKVFKAMLHASPTRIVIHDKYALANPSRLLSFIAYLKVAVRSLGVPCPKSVHINAGPWNKNIPNQKEEWSLAKDDGTQRVASDPFWQDVVFDVKFREHIHGAVGLEHHDRIIECITDRPNGRSSKVTLELTNGIDTLMGNRETMRAYVFRNT
jgi:hypothetical protein